jgi:transposase
LVQRVEVITGKERRRRWSDEEKHRLVTEAFGPGAIVAQVARQHGVAESCLYSWRKQFAEQVAGAGRVESEQPALIPVMIEAAPAATSPPQLDQQSLPGHAIVTFPDGTRAEVPAGYPAAALRALVAALRHRR